MHLVSFNALDDLRPRTATFIDLISGGGAGPFVRTPAGIDFRNDHLYICDTGAAVVHDWNLATGSARRIGASDDTPLVTPVDVAVDDAGNILVADTGLRQVMVFDASGSAVLTVGGILRSFRVNPIGQFAPVESGSEVFDGHFRHPPPGTVRRAPQMRQDDRVFQFQKRMLQVGEVYRLMPGEP